MAKQSWKNRKPLRTKKSVVLLVTGKVPWHHGRKTYSTAENWILATSYMNEATERGVREAQVERKTVTTEILAVSHDHPLAHKTKGK